MINISTIFDLVINGKKLLENTQLIISTGEKYGLIGKNGIGKTSLLNYINKIQNIDIYMVVQEIKITNDTVINYILKSNQKRCEILEKYYKLVDKINNDTSDELLKEFKEITEIMSQNEIDKDESKIKKILHGLGFSIEDITKPITEFSGGWKMRISLATALFNKPELLLLDEPTNHLDLEACIWLTDYLSKWKNTLIIVSHDINFLDNICTQIMYINNDTKKLKYYKGNYTKYEKMKEIDDKTLENEWEKLDKTISDMKKKSTKREIIDEYIKKKNLDPRQKPYKILIDFPEVSHINGNIIECNNLSFGYSCDKMLFKDISFGIDMKSRITFVGKNGIGKTTLMKLLLGKINSLEGNIKRDYRIRIEYYSQHAIQELPTEMTPIEYIQRIDNKIDIQYIRKLLGKIGLNGDLQQRQINSLSGGQKVRVSLIAIQIRNPHLIILDEPTNHLDIETIQALIKGINEYNGGILMITHDIRLITETDSILYQVTEDGIYETTYQEYENEILNNL
jgi:ATPase subunit of ABC transporter with duplicated ATPase domains